MCNLHPSKFQANWKPGRGGSIRPNPEGQKLKTKWPNRKAEFNHKTKNSTSINLT